ncbi:MAG: hypothetical protein ACJA13_002241 [Paraglaciecola sp.]|jgi:hypothetical protein
MDVHVRKLQRAAKEIGVYGLYLDAESNATNFYLSLGFTRLDSGGRMTWRKCS